MYLELDSWGYRHHIQFKIGKYYNNNLCIQMISIEDGYPETWSTLTVNFDRACPINTAFIDVFNNKESIIEWLISNQLGHLTGNLYSSGFCVYPEFEFYMGELLRYEYRS